MVEIASIPLENEMDLIVAGKKSIKIADFLNLSLSSQTAFSTAISEICREIIEKHSGVLTIWLRKDVYAYYLIARIKCDNTSSALNENLEGIRYAKRLITQFSIVRENQYTIIELKINVPKSMQLLSKDPTVLIEQFLDEETLTPYEEVKKKNILLSKISQDQVKKLHESEYLNQKKNEFFSIASHELKTPLTSIKAYAQLALQMGNGECSEPVKGFLEKIDAQATKLNRLIQQLLDIAKIENGKLDLIREEVNINHFITETIALLKDIHPNHNIILKPVPDARVFIDKLRLEQAFVNILGNAAKYSKTQTNITVSTAIDGDYIQCSIVDEGLGISAESISKVFDKFFRSEDVSQKYSGFGMGLFITAKIIEENHGKIWVESIPGKGSSFYFTLPLLAGQTV